MDRIFHLKENGTTVRTEILAGLTTFMTMAYIIALNPNLLTGFAVGTPLWNGVFLATCIASAIGTVCMAFLANKPFVMAPGMGLNSFFAVIAGNIAAMLNTDYTSAFQAVLCIILVEGIVFLILSVFNIRDKIVHAIPLGVRLGIGPAIGLMLMNIGLGSNVGIYAEGNDYASPFYVLRDFFGAMTPSVIKEHMGAEYSTMVLTVVTMFIGLFVIILLAKKGVKAAVLVGMLAASVIYWAGSFIFLKVNPFASLEGASFLPPFHDMATTTLFKFDFSDFFGAMTPSVIKDHMGAEYSQMVLTVVTMFIGLFVIILLAKKGIKAAVLVGMLAASVIYWAGCFIFLGTNPFASLEGASFLPPFHDMVETTLFKFDFADFFNIGWFTAISLIITFCMIDMFDTIGTLVGTASRAGMTDKEGNMPKMKEALLSDAVGTVAGACCGTSTVTTFVESASGVEAGGRTGLTSLTAAVMFLACMFIAPVAAVIPAAATSSALIYVGILMLQGLRNVDFDDLDQVVPVFLMLLAMPISGSIGHGIGIAMITYTVIKVFSGRAKEVSVLTYVISLLFIIKFFAVV